MTKRLSEFLFEVGMLKKTPRSGYQFLGSGGESVADHSFRTAVIGYILASKETNVDKHKVLLMCLFHDLHEARTGDLNYVNKRYVEADEQSAVRDQVNGYFFSDEIISLADEFNSLESMESRLSKDADQLDLILELKEQHDLGNPQATDWLHYAVKRLLTEGAKKLAEEILETESTSWWFKRKVNWWVNGPNNNEKNDR